MIPAARRSRWTIVVNRFGAASARGLRLCRLGTCARVIPIPPRNVSAASDARAPLARRARRRAAACRLSCTRSGSRRQGKSWAKRRLRSPLRPAHGESPRAQSAAWTTGSTTRSTSSPSTSNGSPTRPTTSRPRVSLSTGWRFSCCGSRRHRVRSGAGSSRRSPAARRRLSRYSLNQLIGKFIWHRPRPYETHPQVYHLSHSHDPSFPSDHASAAFGLAFGIYFVDRRVGKFFIAVATLIAAGRVLVGAHYPTDVLASLAVSVVVAYLIVRFARPLLDQRRPAARTHHRSCRRPGPQLVAATVAAGALNGRSRPRVRSDSSPVMLGLRRSASWSARWPSFGLSPVLRENRRGATSGSFSAANRFCCCRSHWC